MARAQITTPTGVTIKITGTPEEITAVARQLAGVAQRHAPVTKAKPKKERTRLIDLLTNLIDGDFFKKPRDLASVKTALEQAGHHYPVTTLSGAMLRQVRQRNLRRMKVDDRWAYVR
jgi:hypothetical protein